MQSKSRIKGLLVFFLMFVMVLGVVLLGASRAQSASAVETAETATETEVTPTDEEEVNHGYAVLYLVMDGVTAAPLMGLHVNSGWEMALWISLLFWILAIIASILMILLLRVFHADDEKPFNRIALLGAIWAFFMPVAGLLLSSVGKRQAKTHEGGKGYYTVGMIVSGLFLGLAVILAIVNAFSPFLPF